MPTFHYIALDQNGQETAGDLDAASEADAVNQLRQSGLYPTSVAADGQGQAAAIKKRVKSSAKGKTKTVKIGANAKVKSKSLMIFTRQLATLIDSGLPLLRGLTVLGRQEPNLVMKGTINTLADNVQTGSTFSESLQQFPRIFNKLYINTTNAPTVIKAAKGYIARVSVIVAGAAGAVYDCATTAAAITANEIAVIPATIGPVALEFPCLTGITVLPGAGQIISVSYA
jgi:hypothetical protein